MTTHDLAARLDALESENQLLHARIAELEATTAATDTVVSRRRLLQRVGTVAAVGAGAALGGGLLRADQAAANDGDPITAGAVTSATSTTILSATPPDGNPALQLDVDGNRGLRINTTGSGGYGLSIYAVDDCTGLIVTRNDGAGDYPAGNFYTTAANGAALFATTDHPTSTRNAVGFTHVGLASAAVITTTNTANQQPTVLIENAGDAPGLEFAANNSARTAPMIRVDADGAGGGLAIANTTTTNTAAMVTVQNAGSGRGVSVRNTDDETSASGIYSRVSGVGAAVEGRSDNGRGAVLTGKVAQVRLAPGTSNTHPTTGSRGDLYCDSTGRLWFCKGGTRWVQVA